MCENSFGSLGRTIVAIIVKTGREYRALKADRTVLRGEGLKQVTPLLVSSNSVQRNVKKVAGKDRGRCEIVKLRFITPSLQKGWKGFISMEVSIAYGKSLTVTDIL